MHTRLVRKEGRDGGRKCRAYTVRFVDAVIHLFPTHTQGLQRETPALRPRDCERREGGSGWWRANCWLLALAAPASSGPASAVSLASLTLHFSPICFQNGFFARGNWLIKRTASLAGSQARCRSLPPSLSCQLGLPRLSLAFISCHLIKQTTDFGTKSCQTCMFQMRAFHILVRPESADRARPEYLVDRTHIVFCSLPRSLSGVSFLPVYFAEGRDLCNHHDRWY